MTAKTFSRSNTALVTPMHADGRVDEKTFADFVNANGYASPIRTPRGRDILAACGQLKSESERLRIKERLALEAMVVGHGEG